MDITNQVKDQRPSLEIDKSVMEGSKDSGLFCKIQKIQVLFCKIQK